MPIKKKLLPPKPRTLLIEEFDPEEKEDDGSDYFHPSLNFAIGEINIKTEQQSGHFLLDMLKHGEINLNTPFQRSPDLWSPALMSRFIESMMLKFPIPPFYFNISYKNNDTAQPYWEVIDGLQRLSAIKNFFFGNSSGKKLALRGLDFFPELEDVTVDDLPRHLRRNIEACQITLFEIFPNTPKVVKYRIFERVNTGGLKLNDQEIRHALNQGRAVQILARAVKECLIANGINLEPGRMKDQELALRFIAFQTVRQAEFGGSMKDFLDLAMERLSGTSDLACNALIETFKDSVAFVKELFGDLAFRKESGRGINKALFDSYTYAASTMDNKIRKKALSNRSHALVIYLKSFDDELYSKSVSYATARLENIERRFGVAKNVLEKIAQ